MGSLQELLAPWLSRLAARSLDVRVDALADPEKAPDVWLQWPALKTSQESDWIWQLETMELLDLACRVDHAAAWTALLDALDQRDLLHLFRTHVVYPRFRTVVCDRVYEPSSFVLLALGELLDELLSHTPDFQSSKAALLARCPETETPDRTRIPLWIQHDPEDTHRLHHRTRGMLTKLCELATWLQSQTHGIFSCFRIARVSLSVYDQRTLDNMAWIVAQLTWLGVQVDVLTDTTQLPCLLRDTAGLRISTQDPNAGIRQIALSPDLEMTTFQATCAAICMNDVTEIVSYWPRESSRRSPDEAPEESRRRLELLTLALFIPGRGRPIRRRVTLHLDSIPDSDAHLIQRVVSDRPPVQRLPASRSESSDSSSFSVTIREGTSLLAGTQFDSATPFILRDGSLACEVVDATTSKSHFGVLAPGIGFCWVRRSRVSIESQTPSIDTKVSDVCIDRLKISVSSSVSLSASRLLLSAVAPLCRRLKVSLGLGTPAEQVLAEIFVVAPQLQRLDIRFGKISSFAWLAEANGSRLEALSLQSSYIMDMQGLLDLLSDVSSPVHDKLRFLGLSWSSVIACFDDFLAMLAVNRRLEKCVIFGRRDGVYPLSPSQGSQVAAFKTYEVPIARQQAPLSLRTKLAFLSATAASESPFPILSATSQAQIFEFAAIPVRRVCVIRSRK